MTTRKAPVVLGGLLLCGLLALLLSLDWVHGTPRGGLGGGASMALDGSTAAAPVRPTVFTTAAALLVAAFLGPVARRVAAVVVLVSGAVATWASAVVLADPAAPVARTAAEEWGLASAGSVTAVAEATLVPWLAAVVGLLFVCVGVLLLRARWDGLSSRYDGVRSRPEPDEPLWDRLSRGDDPT